MDRGQKTARHSSWEEASRRYWEKIFIALHSTSLPLHWRTERSNRSLKLLMKLDPFTTDSLIYYAYLLSTISECEIQATSSRRWQVQVSERSFLPCTQKTTKKPKKNPTKNQKNPKPWQNPTSYKEIKSNLHIMVDSEYIAKATVFKVVFYYKSVISYTHSWTDNLKV